MNEATRSKALRDYWRERRAEQRVRAKKLGICTICLSRKARAGMATCQPCSDAATKRTAARRAEQR